MATVDYYKASTDQQHGNSDAIRNSDEKFQMPIHSNGFEEIRKVPIDSDEPKTESESTGEMEAWLKEKENKNCSGEESNTKTPADQNYEHFRNKVSGKSTQFVVCRKSPGVRNLGGKVMRPGKHWRSNEGLGGTGPLFWLRPVVGMRKTIEKFCWRVVGTWK